MNNAVLVFLKLLNAPMRNPNIVNICDTARFFWSEISIAERNANGQRVRLKLPKTQRYAIAGGSHMTPSLGMVTDLRGIERKLKELEA
jgi:hypothetical protein